MGLEGRDGRNGKDEIGRERWDKMERVGWGGKEGMGREE